MEQEVSIKRRQLWISRFLALAAGFLWFVFGLYVCFSIFGFSIQFKRFYLQSDWLSSLSAILKISFFLCGIIILSYYLVQVVRSFWKGASAESIRTFSGILAMLGAVLLTFVPHLMIRKKIPHLPEGNLIYVTIFAMPFIFLIGGGIYILFKKLFYFILAQKEDVDVQEFFRDRQWYIAGITFSTYGAVLTLFALSTKTHIFSYKESLFLVEAVVIPLFSAWFCYRLCCTYFIRRPLKKMKERITSPSESSLENNRWGMN
jgi:hypothetical protein